MAARAPRESQIDQGKSASAKRQADRDAANEIAQSQAVAFGGDFSLLDKEVGANRSPDRVLDALLQRDQISATEPIVVVTAQESLAVDFGAPQRRLEVERHLAARASG